MQLGIALQLLVVGVSLGALLAASAVRCELAKAIGVTYLCNLDWQQFRAPEIPLEIGSQSHSPGNWRALIMHGFQVNASNPKATIFLLSGLPQFIDALARAAESGTAFGDANNLV